MDVEKAAAAFETTINQSCTTTDKTTEISKNELANLTQQYIQARQEVADKATVADRVILQATSWGVKRKLGLTDQTFSLSADDKADLRMALVTGKLESLDWLVDWVLIQTKLYVNDIKLQARLGPGNVS